MLRRGVSLLLDAFAPRRCPGCEAVCPAALCAACAAALLAAPAPHSRRQAHGLAAAAFTYAGPVRAALHHGKYRGDRAVLRELAQLGVPRLRTALRAPEAVVALPLGARRLRRRGYNQAEVVAELAAASLGVPLRGGLVRVRETAPQSERDEAARRRNVEGAFTWVAGPLGGARVWLVDDVLTTGATSAAAAQALADGGAGGVDVAVIAAVA